MSRRRSGGGRTRSSDWVISASGTDATGAVTTPVNWGGPVQTVGAGSQNHFQPVVLAPAITASNAVPSIGQVDIIGLDCTFQISSVSAAGYYVGAACLYVSEYNTSQTKWAVRSPIQPTDAARDDNLHIMGFAFNAPLAAAETNAFSLKLRLLLPYAIRLGGGQALHCCLDNGVSSAGNILFTPFIRARIARPS